MFQYVYRPCGWLSSVALQAGTQDTVLNRLGIFGRNRSKSQVKIVSLNSYMLIVEFNFYCSVMSRYPEGFTLYHNYVI